MNERNIFTALTIAGSDSSGGAGIQADIKTFQANGVFGMSAITAVTVQNTKGVTGIQNIDPEIVKGQIDAIFEDINVNAVKIGMLSNERIIDAVYDSLKVRDISYLVLDPVMISKSGFLLIEESAIKKLKEKLFKLSYLVTPNLHEASKITGLKIHTIKDMEDAAEAIYNLGCKNVLVKGGHLEGDDCIDVLFTGEKFFYFSEKRFDTKNTHGTGCTLSSAIAANLAKGINLEIALKNAKEYISKAIESSLDIGHGCGPTHHFYKYY